MVSATSKHVAIIGGGPAGLAAAQVLSEAGCRVEVFDAMPSFGRKFLMAGKSGLNITHSAALDTFLSRYTAPDQRLVDIVRAFSAGDIIAWMRDLGVEPFVGTSGRVFPQEMKASPLLRAWLARLDAHRCSLFSSSSVAWMARLRRVSLLNTRRRRPGEDLTQLFWPLAAAAGNVSDLMAHGQRS